MKQFILSVCMCMAVLTATAQARPPVVGQVTQADKEKPLSVEQVDQDISIYPNPSEGIFTISVSNLSAHTADLRILNVIGNEILHEKLTRGEGQFAKTIDLSNLAKGLYYVKLETDNFSAVRRVIIK
ncbi:T9SS type A sorting domain-containing protein [Pontibacter sp. 172403-2]|uniref:T9SS type A sorting domain-containing protein n=1 Tax=Pontibacter rufus TaxID=2791028 RepID=UPI0018AF9924|nr:T9SS type A sorting domain-containing protein [Pontibacter sp. 172403-2]MBF9251702.1 T9SS type A sorting domain-containing protein [Pontibacter sp. 172403-2]